MKGVKVLIIGNPTSGGGRARGSIEVLARELDRRGHQVETYLTTAAGDGARRAGDLAPDLDALVVAGGDGTLNEVLNGLVDPSRVPLTQMASGTANILARELGLPFDPEGMAGVVHAHQVRRVDLGDLEGRRFLMVVSAGFDAQVTDELQRSRQGTLGFVGYVKPVLRVLGQYRPPELVVTVDGRGGTRGSWVVATKTRNYGGLFTLAERAALDSGHLDVLVFRGGGMGDFLRYGLHGLGGRGVSRMDGVTYLTGTSVRIESAGDQPVHVEVDGDHWGVTPVRLSVAARVVPLLVPPGA